MELEEFESIFTFFSFLMEDKSFSGVVLSLFLKTTETSNILWHSPVDSRTSSFSKDSTKEFHFLFLLLFSWENFSIYSYLGKLGRSDAFAFLLSQI